MIRSIASVVMSGVLALLLTASAQAQSPELFNRNATAPDINSIPILNEIVRNGAKLFYMGERSGLHGWFILKDGQIQMIYVTSDRKTAMIGALFTEQGENVTGPQIEALASVNKEVETIMSTPAKQQEDVTKAGGVQGGFAAVPGGTAVNGSASAPNNALPMVSLSPGERLLQDLQAAAGVTLGNNNTSEILMVMDTDCPGCKATWKELKSAVASNQVQLKLIPVVNNPAKGDSNAAAQLLKVENPLETWDKYVNGDKSALAGEADSLRLKAVMSNNQLIEKWNIRYTPYLVYRAKDGKVKIVQGKPERMAAVLTDILK